MRRVHRLLYQVTLAAVAVMSLHAALARDGGLDLAGMDRSVKPGNDFFAYANGRWFAKTRIPADRADYGTFSILSEAIDKQVADLIRGAAQAAAKSPAAGSEAQKIGDYYLSYMDEAAIEARGKGPLAAPLARIAGIKDKKALAAELGAQLRADVDALNASNFYTDNLFGLWVAADLDQPGRYAPYLLQGGLSLPDRDYYLADAPKMIEIRARFQEHIATVLSLAGIGDAKNKARRIFALETAIARIHWARADSEDVAKADNHWSRSHFAKDAPGLDWPSYFAAAHLTNVQEFVVWQPSALIGESALVAATSLADWKDYLQFHYIDHNAMLLSKAFVADHFAFYGKVLNGTPELQPRWKRAVAATNAALGEAVGKLYVARHFSSQDKAAIQGLVRNLVAAFGRRIDSLTWMSPQTKIKAHAKLTTLRVGVGYPDHWRTYDGLEIAPGDAFGNAQRAELFATQQKVARLSQPVDRDEWVMNPQLVNAVNLPVLNALNFPAAILQPPYFDATRHAALNYGAIGAVIGHEISHSFDSAGALFDATGRLSNWWTDADLAHFHAAAQQLVRQFDSYKPFPDLAVNGRQTLDENIADVAGLAVALDAYHIALAGAAAPSLDGLSGDQQFFIAYAQNWREKMRAQRLRQLIITNGHAPSRYRADTVRNLPAWYTAFAVKPGDALYLAPDQRAQIW
ncbi:MAG TPA: M13 family metallopeptidase [Steroidobacteraceae bacterium]